MKDDLRQFISRRAEGICEYCHLSEEFDLFPFQIDHLIAKQHLGPTEESNLAWSCYHCNVHKGPNLSGLDPETTNIVPLYHPRKDSWNDHFQWVGAELIGSTSTGRATLQVLAINLRERFLLRKLLLESGLAFK